MAPLQWQAQDHAAIKRVLSVAGLDEAKRRMSNAWCDPWFAEKGTIPTFASRLDTFVKSPMGAPPPRVVVQDEDEMLREEMARLERGEKREGARY